MPLRVHTRFRNHHSLITLLNTPHDFKDLSQICCWKSFEKNYSFFFMSVFTTGCYTSQPDDTLSISSTFCQHHSHVLLVTPNTSVCLDPGGGCEIRIRPWVSDLARAFRLVRLTVAGRGSLPHPDSQNWRCPGCRVRPLLQKWPAALWPKAGVTHRWVRA